MAQGLTVATLLVLKKYMQIMQKKTNRGPPIALTNSRVRLELDLLERLFEGVEEFGLDDGGAGVVVE